MSFKWMLGASFVLLSSLSFAMDKWPLPTGLISVKAITSVKKMQNINLIHPHPLYHIKYNPLTANGALYFKADGIEGEDDNDNVIWGALRKKVEEQLE